jgi:cell division septum initiation protein DivIVA
MLPDDVKERIKGIFSDWLDLDDSRKEIGQQMNELIKSVAESTGFKPTSIRKAFAFAKSKRKNAEDALDSVVDVFQVIDER